MIIVVGIWLHNEIFVSGVYSSGLLINVLIQRVSDTSADFFWSPGLILPVSLYCKLALKRVPRLK